MAQVQNDPMALFTQNNGLNTIPATSEISNTTEKSPIDENAIIPDWLRGKSEIHSDTAMLGGDTAPIAPVQ